MYKKKIPVSLDCGLNLFTAVTNGKWKISLIWCIYNDIKRPGEIQRKIPKASRRVLDTQLQQLTDHGIIVKNSYDQLPPKVEYELTPLGRTLIPLITHLAQWGEDHRQTLEDLIEAAEKKQDAPA
ncbi:helix-turn-helix domain-containing protein [Fluviicola sp.]|uniref:winged helix-turn-helix transcriptional regulator n=1 Tax=Fluviicola sp. TaxID=1917219 RepID=UPI0031E40E5A